MYSVLMVHNLAVRRAEIAYDYLYTNVQLLYRLHLFSTFLVWSRAVD